LALVLAFTACPNPTNGGDDGPGSQVETVGHITGTITLTGYSGERPAVGINAQYSGGNWVDNRGENHPVNADGSFSIPFTQNFLNALHSGDQTLQFRLYIGSGNDVFSKTIETTRTVSKDTLTGPAGDTTLSVENLGSVNIAVITLSGTVTVAVDSRPVSRVEIIATLAGGGSWLGSTQVYEPGSGAAWSIRLAARESAETLSFTVLGYTADGSRIFEKSGAATVDNVSNENKAGIAINLGDLKTITLSGTLSVADDGEPIPRVYIEARAVSGSSSTTIGSTSLTSPATGGASWSLTVLALEEAQKVRFYVYGYDDPNGGNQIFNKTLEPEQTASVSNTSISGIALTIGDINVGRMSGTVTFTDMPSPAPYQIRLSARYGNNSIDQGRWSLIDVSGNTGTWTIPQDNAFLAALESGEQKVIFSLYLQLEQNGSSFTLAQVERTVSKTGLASVDLGDVSLALVTLSGTLTVTDDGNPIPRVQISASSASSSLGSATLASPESGAAWSITIPALDGEKVSFYVYGYDNPNGGNQVFNKTLEPEQTASVSGESISGIVLDLGDINVGRMSGTVTFTNMPSPAPYQISLLARYGNAYINGGQSYTINVSGNTGTWTIPQDSAFLAALGDGEQTVTFSVSLQLEQNESSFTVAQVEKTVSKTGLASINLGTVSLASVTLSGTLNASVNGQTPYAVIIYAYTTNGNIGSIYVASPGANTPWLIRLPPLETSTDVSFRISIVDSSGNTLFTVDNAATAKGVYHQNVGNIAITYAFPPSSATSLTIDQWKDGELEAGQEVWYRFQADGSNYYVSWNDAWAGTDKTCYLRVTAYTGSGSLVSDWSSSGDTQGWTTPKAVSGQSGTVYLLVKGLAATYSGTYAVKYSQSSAGNISAPTNLNANVSGSNVNLYWNRVSGASSYKVYRSASASGQYDQIDSSSSDSYTDSGLSAGTYYYKVSAVSSGGTESSQSDYASATISAGISAPTGLSANVSGDSVNLSWTSASGASYYKVYRSNSSSGPYNQINGSVSGTSSTDSGLPAGTYYYKVSAVSSSGTESPQSSYASATVSGGGDTLAGAKGKMTLTGFSEFNGKYVFSALVTASGKYLTGTNGVDYNAGDYRISMVPISGGTAEVPLYTTNESGTTIADIYVPYEGSESIQTVSIIIVDDADGKFTASEAASFGTNYAAIIGSNTLNTSFTPSTSSGSITISRSDAITTAEMTGDNMYTAKYMLILKQ
jgi:hypothetical protein